jgi:prepilin-type N-terminal cleavage/methylation domain-containing protein
MPNPSSRAGFTLIEVMVVIIIIGIVMAVVFPRFSSMGKTYLKTDASKLQSLITYLYEASETRKLYYRMNFDLEKESVLVEFSRDGVEYEPEADRAIRALSFAPGVDLAEVEVAGAGVTNTGELQVEFAPTGTTRPFRVSLGARGLTSITVTFNPYSGRARIEEAEEAGRRDML